MRAGRWIAAGIPGPELDTAIRERLVALAPSGIVLFARNVSDPQQLRQLTDELHALPSQPLVAMDQEGGRVARLKPPFTRFPPALAVGATDDVALAERIGTAMGHELASAGIDLDFAPVLDVHSNPHNTVIGDRAFGTDPERVTRMALAVHRGLLAAGVLTCGKHFPGHGDTLADSHFDLPRVDRSRAELERVELPPFRAAIAAGIPLMMVAHVIHSALDAQRPASLSPVIVRGLLRQELGYTGVIATDDMDMRAITKDHDLGAAAVLTLRAGCDWVLACQSLESAERAAAAIEAAIDAGDLDARELEQSGARIDELRRWRDRQPRVAVDLPCAEHENLAMRCTGTVASA